MASLTTTDTDEVVHVLLGRAEEIGADLVDAQLTFAQNKNFNNFLSILRGIANAANLLADQVSAAR